MNRKITILEDDMDIREICTFIFSEEGYEVQGFADVVSFNGSPTLPSIFLLDIRLPDGDGREVCNRLKSDPLYAAIPVIMMSANTDRASVMADCSADDFIQKPFDIENMLQKVGRLVD